MPIVFLHCHRHRDWVVQFLEPDLKTPVHPTRFHLFRTLDPVREMLTRGNASLEDALQFDTDIRRWGIGTAWLNLTEEQYRKLKK